MVMERVYQPAVDLLRTPLFQPKTLPPAASAQRSFERAKAIGLSYGVSLQDVTEFTDKFWALHRDPMFLIDGGAGSLLTIQYNLCVGTMSQYLKKRSDLKGLVDDMLSWRVASQFCLTELGHGLDVGHLETVAEMLPNGSFCLNTPTASAAKYMPPTTPVGTPLVALIWARMKVGSEDRGMRPFIVKLNDGFQMSPGVTVKVLPYRGGSKPLDHSLTYFNNVILPASSMLGPYETTDKVAFSEGIFRIAVGTAALGVVATSVLRTYATIGARYSLRRTVQGTSSVASPILSFRTQQMPILTAVAQAHVLGAFSRWITKGFSNVNTDRRVRHGLAACIKVVGVQLSQAANISVSDRCGAQGLFEYNQMSSLHPEIRGLAISEGDTLVLSIKLATEMLLGRYNLPEPLDPSSILARHETSLRSEAKEILRSLSSHRSLEFNRLVLPLCLPIVEAIGHRMAYDAAVLAGVPQCLIDLFVCSVMKYDPAWYSEEGGLSRRERFALENKALDETMAKLEEFVDQLQAEPYITAPIVADEKWDNFVAGLSILGQEMPLGLSAHL